MKNLFRTLIALIAILSLACTALAEYKTPTTDYEVWQEYTPRAKHAGGCVRQGHRLPVYRCERS